MTPDFASYRLHLGEFIRRASRSPDRDTPRLEAEFNTLALTLFHLQFEQVPPYRRLCETRGVEPAHVHDWADIPCVPTAAFKDLDLTSLPAIQRPHVFHSSGTTRQRPSRHFHNADSLALYEHSLLAPFRDHVLNRLDKPVQLICLTPSPARAPHSSLVHMFDTVRREYGTGDSLFTGGLDETGAWVVDGPATRQALTQAAANGRPVVMLGTAFAFVELLDEPSIGHPRSWILDPLPRLSLPPNSRVMETGGYKGRRRELPKAALHQLLTDRLGVLPSHLVCEYSMSELSSQAYDHVAGQEPEPGGRVFRFPPWARSVLVSPETDKRVGDDETGLIRVFDLANVHSVMAIQTEDLGMRRGDGFELVGRAAAAEARGCSLMNLGDASIRARLAELPRREDGDGF